MITPLAASGHGVRISHVEVEKAAFPPEKRRDERKRGVALGAGSAAAGVGLVGGGIPGVQPNSRRYYEDVKQAREAGRPLPKAKELRHKASAARGGIFGYRVNAHENKLSTLKGQLKHEWSMPGKPVSRMLNNQDAHVAGMRHGQIQAERKILRTLKRGRKASNAALIGGAGAVAYGLHGRRDVSKATDLQDKRNATAVTTAGVLTAAGSQAGGRALQREGRKWATRAEADQRYAERINPNVGGYTKTKRKWGVPDIAPHTDPKHTARRFAHDLNDQTKSQARMTGALRGRAKQARYFGEVYGKNGMRIRRYGTPAGVGLAAVGLAGHRYKVVNRKEGVEKANPLSRASRAARKARRRARLQDIAYQASKPVIDEARAAGRQFTRTAETAIERQSKRAQRRLITGLGVGLTAGVGGGMALGGAVHRKVTASKSDYELATPPITDYPAGSYNYLLPTLRSDQVGIPSTRRNPISPIAQAAMADLGISGYRKVRSRNPFFRRRRQRQGAREIVLATTFGPRGIGEAL